MGITEDNWPATVGLLSGMLAKEVVVGTLGALYSQQQAEDSNITVEEKLQLAVVSIREKIHELGSNVFKDPLNANVPHQVMPDSVLGEMVNKFKEPLAAGAYLLFVLLYFPCVSVVAAIRKELNNSWALFSVVWTTGLAYSVAVIFYQVGTFALHPLYSGLWITALLASIGICIFVLALLESKKDKQPKLVSVPTTVLLAD